MGVFQEPIQVIDSVARPGHPKDMPPGTASQLRRFDWSTCLHSDPLYISYHKRERRYTVHQATNLHCQFLRQQATEKRGQCCRFDRCFLLIDRRLETKQFPLLEMDVLVFEGRNADIDHCL